ncbi:MAG: hypothetical protein HXX17_01050 [Geobacteraceae bacterium]|nr:hypothetical protein [Geobacteraceae bacterium]
MKKIKSQIEELLKLRPIADGTVEGLFTFPPDFIGFQGHFPGGAILPGACQIQALLSLLEKSVGKSLALKEVVLAKYLVPVLPNEEIAIKTAEVFVPEISGSTVKAVITRAGVKVSEIKICAALQESL